MEKGKGSCSRGGQEGPLPEGSLPAPAGPSPRSLPSQLLLTTRTLVDGAGASEFPEEFRSQELWQVQGGGKPDSGRQAGLSGGGGAQAGWALGTRLGKGARGNSELLLPTVPPWPPHCGAMVVNVVVVVGLGVSQQVCGWGEDGMNPRHWVSVCVCVCARMPGGVLMHKYRGLLMHVVEGNVHA